MSELTEQQRLLSTELWLRTQIGPNEEYWYPLLKILFRIIDDLRAPIDMVLHCPACGVQHIDAPSDDACPEHGVPPTWTNPPHRSHLCHGCGHVWRPADVPTNGVAAVKTRGKNDSEIATGNRAEALLREAAQHAEWRDKNIYPCGGETFQNWLLQIYLPVPLSEPDKSPEAALRRALREGPR